MNDGTFYNVVDVYGNARQLYFNSVAIGNVPLNTDQMHGKTNQHILDIDETPEPGTPIYYPLSNDMVFVDSITNENDIIQLLVLPESKVEDIPMLTPFMPLIKMVEGAREALRLYKNDG